MASAGRVLILPKGDYDSTKEYEMLDLVFHGGTSWLAKKSSVGVEPSDANNEYWFKMCQSVDLSEIIMRIAALESQMLGAISLDDIDLSGYATKLELNDYATKTEMNSINTSLDGRLDVVEPMVTTLISDVNTAKTNILSLQTLINGISGSTKITTGTYTGTISATHEGKSKTITTTSPSKLLFVLGQPTSSGGVTSITVLIPSLGIGNTLCKDNSMALQPLTVKTSGNNVTMEDNIEGSNYSTNFICNRANTKYYWISLDAN